MMSIFDFFKIAAEDIYKTANEKGFWELNLKRPKGEMVMLVITELAEAVEAHRKHRRFAFDKTVIMTLDKSATTENPADAKKVWNDTFLEKVKDTVEDEMADAVIRILDYTKGFDIPIVKREYRKNSTGNFANDVLRLTHYCICAYHSESGEETKDWGYALSAINEFCKWYSIDLAQHIHWKMEYNSNRPYKHGKAY